MMPEQNNYRIEIGIVGNLIIKDLPNPFYKPNQASSATTCGSADNLLRFFISPAT